MRRGIFKFIRSFVVHANKLRVYSAVSEPMEASDDTPCCYVQTISPASPSPTSRWPCLSDLQKSLRRRPPSAALNSHNCFVLIPVVFGVYGSIQHFAVNFWRIAFVTMQRPTVFPLTSCGIFGFRAPWSSSSATSSSSCIAPSSEDSIRPRVCDFGHVDVSSSALRY